LILKLYLLVELDEGRFELLVEVSAEVVGVLSVRQRHACLILVSSKVSLGWGLGHCVQGHLDIVAISVLFQLIVRNLLVVNDSGVVRGHISWKFGEVGRHDCIKMDYNTTVGLTLLTD